jgi:hypothetical protein
MNFHNLLSLPHLLARQIVRKIHLKDYSQSHVVRFVDCLAILKKKVFKKQQYKQLGKRGERRRRKSKLGK